MKNALYLEWDRGHFLFFYLLLNGGRHLVTVVF